MISETENFANDHRVLVTDANLTPEVLMQHAGESPADSRESTGTTLLEARPGLTTPQPDTAPEHALPAEAPPTTEIHPLPAAVGVLSDAAIERRNAWARIAEAYDCLIVQTHAAGQPSPSVRQAARLLEVPHSTLNKVLKRRAAGKLAPDYHERGATCEWETFADRPDVRQKLHQLYLLSCGASSDYMSKGRRTGSMASALKVFAREPICPPDLAEILLAGLQPVALKRAVREMHDLHEQKLRGPKHSSLNASIISRRDRSQIKPGDEWVFDDMSDNLPHWWTGPDDQPCLGRQGLYCYDGAGRWIGVEKVGTLRDAYTAAIILRFFRRLMTAFGKPRKIILERGVWMSNCIKGFKISPKGAVLEEEFERPAMDKAESAELIGGLEKLGIDLHYAYTPRGKIIEGAFNHLQRLKPMIAQQWSERRAAATLNLEPGTLNAPPALNIGRHAGEFEHGAKQMRRVRARSHHPADLGFLHIEDSLSIDLEVMEFINANQGDYPALRPLEPNDHAVFLPEKRELLLKDGRVTATVDGTPLDFYAPELFATVGNHYRLGVKFDPSEPTLGAALYNLETSSVNHQGWRLGELIGWGQYQPPIGWTGRAAAEDPQADPMADLRRRFNKHVRTAFGAVGLKHARISSARDGRGNVAETSGTAQPSTVSRQPSVPQPSTLNPQPAPPRPRTIDAVEALFGD